MAEQERILPAVTPGQQLATDKIEAQGHTTQPPARLTEASLVKEMEARGIGRPSTYASIIERHKFKSDSTSTKDCEYAFFS